MYDNRQKALFFMAGKERQIMSGNYKKEDLRVQKTHKYLRRALEILLNRRNFRQITVNDLCEEALISRAAFYSHFRDKYHLLEAWLFEIADKYYALGIEKAIDALVYENAKCIKNIVQEADSETLAIVHNFALRTMDMIFEENKTDKNGGEYIILSNFCVGGLLQFVLWQIENRYPQDIGATRNYLKRLLEGVIRWDAEKRTQS